MATPLLDYQISDIRRLLEIAMEGCDGEFRAMPQHEVVELVAQIEEMLVRNRHRRTA
jgi:hypothetical protein